MTGYNCSFSALAPPENRLLRSLVKSGCFASYHGVERNLAAMCDTIDVNLTLTRDKPDSMNFEDTYSGLGDVWYRFEADAKGNVGLLANADGFEHLARYFLKMASTGKRHGYHAHHTLEFGKLPGENPELTITFVSQPQ